MIILLLLVKHILEGGGLYDVIFGSKWKVGS